MSQADTTVDYRHAAMEKVKKKEIKEHHHHHNNNNNEEKLDRENSDVSNNRKKFSRGNSSGGKIELKSNSKPKLTTSTGDEHGGARASSPNPKKSTSSRD